MFKFVTTRERSALMSKIKSNNTKPEVALRKKLWGWGVRFSKNAIKLPGKPDLAINKYKIAVFIDGEFWHGYKWSAKKKAIKSNRSYWVPKIERNMLRDKSNNRALKKMGWAVARFWQHSVEDNLEGCANSICELVKARENGKA